MINCLTCHTWGEARVWQVWRCQCHTTTPIGVWGCGEAGGSKKREVWQMAKSTQEMGDLGATTGPRRPRRNLMREAASLAMRPPERPTAPAHIPFDKCDVMTLVEASKLTRKPADTIKDWCLRNGFDGRVGAETWIWKVSGFALAMMLEEDMKPPRVISLDRTLF